jgi:hydroxyacylglutathione hydrolase
MIAGESFPAPCSAFLFASLSSESPMLKFDTIPVGLLSVNCYLLWNTQTLQTYIIDPGAEAEKISARLQKLSLQPAAILLTHAHVDHIQAVPELATQYHIPVWIHPGDLGLYLSPENALLPWIPATENLPQPLTEAPKLEGLEFELLHTPGHSKGSVCFHFAADKLLFSGDTIFRGTHGRTDFPGGSQSEIIDSITNIIFKLPEETRLLPGHQEPSTVAAEKNNPMY